MRHIQKVSNYFSSHFQADLYSDYLLPPIAFFEVPTVRDLVEEVMWEVMSKDFCYFGRVTYKIADVHNNGSITIVCLH